MRKGMLGLWDRLTGEHQRTRKQNEAEAMDGLRRDRAQRQRLVYGQLSERQSLQQQIRTARHRYALLETGLHRDMARQFEAREESAAPQKTPPRAGESSRASRTPEGRRQGRRGRVREPEMGR
jgi:hypothetical protein